MNLRYIHVKAAAFAVSLTAFLSAGVFVPAGSLPGDCGTVFAAATTDYSYLTNAFKARVPYAESRKDDRGRSLSTLIDCGDHYELTSVNLYAYKKYDAETVENLTPGERFAVEGKAYILKEIRESGERVLERNDAVDTECASLIPVNPGRNKKGYYISVKQGLSDGSRDSADLYYSGSVFFRKDCVMQSLGLQEDGTRGSVDAETYFTTDRNSLLPEGLYSYGKNAAEDLISVCGSIVLDSEGYVVSYTEKY